MFLEFRIFGPQKMRRTEMKRREIFGEGKYLVRDGGEIWRWNRSKIFGKVKYFFAEEKK